jgi:molybdopterin-binding protein
MILAVILQVPSYSAEIKVSAHITARNVEYGTTLQQVMNESRLLTPREAAARIGVSYTALKHWIHIGRIRTVKTAGGHHRIPVDVVYEFLPPKTPRPVGVRDVGCQNQLAGTILEITVDGLIAKIVMKIESQEVTALIAADEARDLNLKPGESAVALVKSTSVMIGRP